MILAETHPWTAWGEWSAVWGELERASPRPSFFLTPEWVEAWLEIFGPTTKPRIVAFRRDPGGEVAGLCLLVFRTQRLGPFPIHRVYLNTAGEPEADDACVEYNALLCRAGWEDAVAAALAAYLEREKWDEFVASGMSAGPALDALLRSALGGLNVIRSDVPSHFVDLRRFAASSEGYVGTLSRNTREQTRRSRRGLEARGPLAIQEVSDLQQASHALTELAALHTASWNARGKPGVFASAAFREFHERLIHKTFLQGRIQLLRMSAGEEKLAVLYNFVYDRKAWFYQSGLRIEADKRLKPGLVAHALAIEHCCRTGLQEYDFLAGDDQYKKSLANGSRVLSWLVFRKGGPKLAAVDLLRAAKRVLMGRSRPPSRSSAPAERAS